jgi:tetratricopeptide (TPR) repeat protein
MKILRFSPIRLFICVVVIATGSFFHSAKAAETSGLSPLFDNNSNTVSTISTISGQVWDPFNRPARDIYVELQNELYMTIARQRTSAGGRFVFTNLSSGTYVVKVLSLGTDYLEQAQTVQILILVQGGSDQAFLDFHLKYDPRKVNIGSNGMPVEIFVQDGISDEARKRYGRGVDLLAKKKDEGLAEIEQALQISPNYYDALIRLGAEYVQRKQYQNALPYLIKAIDVNQRSYTAFYNLAYACYQLNHIAKAVEAAKAATTIKPANINAQILYGTVLRINGEYPKAETALTRAKKLSKKPVAEIHWQLALVYQKMDRKKETADELEQFLKAQPNTQDAEKIKTLIGQLRTDSTAGTKKLDK